MKDRPKHTSKILLNIILLIVFLLILSINDAVEHSEDFKAGLNSIERLYYKTNIE